MTTHQQFLTAVRPFTELAVEVQFYGFTGFILYPDGRLEPQYTPEATKLLKQIDESIATLRSMIISPGLRPIPVSPPRSHYG